MKNILLCIIWVSVNTLFAQTDKAPHHEVVGDWQGNSYSVIYPLGWSKKGDFAYIFQDVNGMGGAWIYTFDLYIQHPLESEPFFHKEFVYNLEEDTSYHKYEEVIFDPDDSTYFITAWMKHVLWPEQKGVINKVLKEHNIIRSDKKVMHNLTELEKEGISFVYRINSDKENAIRVDTSVYLFYQIEGKEPVMFYSIENKTNEYGLVESEYGYEMDLLYYNIEGFIKSPVGNQYFIYIHECSMGYEEAAEKLLLVSMTIVD